MINVDDMIYEIIKKRRKESRKEKRVESKKERRKDGQKKGTKGKKKRRKEARKKNRGKMMIMGDDKIYTLIKKKAIGKKKEDRKREITIRSFVTSLLA